jgi:2-alkyl-3-oxoalkanoate reductase
MRLFVTGAAGFLGAAVVHRARAQGHHVTALVRSADRARAALGDDGDVTLLVGDVRDPGPWEAGLDGVDAVIHLAAAKGGDLYGQFGVTVGGTEQLLAAMDRRRVTRLVHISTFSVYDYGALPIGAVLDETAPLDGSPRRRDEYAQTKLEQERLVREWAGLAGRQLTIVRPGAVYGTDNLWDGGHAAQLGGIGLAVAPGAVQKLTHVDNCAAAIVLAAERPEAIGETINVVDDDLPTQRAYERLLRREGVHVARGVPVPYRLARGIADVLDAANRRWFAGRAKLPYFMMPAKLDARFRPLRYSNAKAKRVLDWQPTITLAEGVRRSR